MTVHDGNGWTRCSRGHRHWGRHGAAGLLVAAPGSAGQPTVLLQQRSWWGSHGGAWGPPGGARDSHESETHAALREAAEECALDPASVTVHGVLKDDHGGWSYKTVLANAPRMVFVVAISEETREVAWVPVEAVGSLRLHPGFAEQWDVLRAALMPLTVIVDIANVMGSRPDGWWRDRAGAAERLIGEVAALAARGVTSLPGAMDAGVLERWYPKFVVVLEGVANRARGPAPGAPAPGAPDSGAPGSASGASASGASASGGSASGASERPALQVVRAPGSGDDEIARLAASLPGDRLVVTADRQLRTRCEAAGASVTGPRWLLDLL